MQEYRLIVIVDSEPEVFGPRRFRDMRAAQARVAAAVRYFSAVGDVSAVELQMRRAACAPDLSWRATKRWGTDVVARILAEDAIVEAVPLPESFAAAGGILVERRAEPVRAGLPVAPAVVRRGPVEWPGENGSHGGPAGRGTNGHTFVRAEYAAIAAPARVTNRPRPQPNRHRSARRALAVAASCVAMAVLVLLWLRHDGRPLDALSNAPRGDRLRQLPFEATAFRESQPVVDTPVASPGSSLFGDD